MIRGYLAFMQAEQITNTTRARNVAALKSFFRFLYVEKYTKNNLGELSLRTSLLYASMVFWEAPFSTVRNTI